MSRFIHARSSRAVAAWLFAVAALVFAMVVVGGLTRLTDSGLSITEWKPIMGAIPPLNDAAWASEFAKYQATTEYQQVNRGMSLEDFRTIYWWEWAHRFLGRLIGAAFAIPFAVFLVRRQLPQRLIVPCSILLGLGALQGAIGWWMVVSGLSDRVDVAPERLTVHLGLALVVFVGLLWCGFEALGDGDRTRPPRGWALASGGLLGLAWVQSLLGGLVAGNDAGRIHTDWPYMSGKALPDVDWSIGALRAFLHDPALVQFNHRLGAYLLLAAATIYVIQAFRARMPGMVRLSAALVAGMVWLQAAIGVATLMNAVPLWLGVLHQIGAVTVLGLATWTAWRVHRSEERFFSPGIRSTGL